MNHLTSTNVVKQELISMGDGSGLGYCIEITLQTQQEFSIAYGKIKDLKNITLTEIIERALVHLLNDCPDDDGEAVSDSDGDMLTADDYPESAE
jgi:hypothetical protein